jgi:hypothetical protein
MRKTYTHVTVRQPATDGAKFYAASTIPQSALDTVHDDFYAGAIWAT